MSPADERWLVRAAQRGDLDAFEQLIRLYEVPVYRLALRMLGSSADAEDAAQEALVSAWRSIGGFRGTSSFGTWLYRITTNRCLNHISARRPTAPLDEALPGRASDGPAERAEEHERMSALGAAILRLPPEQRAALVLREFEGLSYDEVGEVLDITLAAVKGRIHRARLQIAEDLAEWR